MFGVYDILETVGQGGMGVVYRAHDTALDRVVALKVLKEDLRQNKQIAARFQREAEAIASLNHPSIVHIYSVGAVGRIPYIAMEFIQGAPLSAVMKRVKTLPWKRALHIAEQVAEALASAHEAHIIHRDIKPGNILIGANDHAYVTDFGIAKVLTAETQLTIEGSRLGTPHYMSPERCSKGDVSTSSDLYSLGIVLFQMLCGRLPYEASSPVDLIRKIVSEPPARLSQYLPDIPEDVERLVAFLIEKKPADRPKSAAYAAELCRRVIEGDPLFEDDGVAASIRDFRDTLPTPSSTTTTHIDSALGDARGLWARAVSAWSAVPASARLWMAGVCVIAAMAAAGRWTAKRSFSEFALGTIKRWDQSTDAWTSPSAPAELVPESEGVTVVRLRFPAHAVARIVPAGLAGFAVELAGRREGPAAIVVVHPDSSSVRVGIPRMGPGDALGGPRLLAGAKPATTASGPEEPYFFISAIHGLAILRGDAAFSDDSYGRPILNADDLRRVIGGNVTEIRGLVASEDGRELAVVVRADSAKGDQLIRVLLAGDAGRTELDPLLLDTAEIAAMVYGEAGDLFVAQKSSKSWSIVRIPPRGSGGRPVPLMEVTAASEEVITLSERGVLVRSTSHSGATAIEWREFSPGTAVDFGEATDAAITRDARWVVLSAPDRRGNAQLWRVNRETPAERRQLTFLAAGIGAGVELSRDGRYAACVAPTAELPGLILVSLEAAGRN
jgi:hypothetical protein